LERVGYRQVLTRDAAVLVLCFADARSFRALLHCSLPLATGGAAVAGGLLFLFASRLVWQRAIGHYTSASS
jgi:ABC-type uncharacterized transport system permease subunit